MNRTDLFRTDRTAVINRAAEHVHNATKGLRANRHRNFSAGGFNLHAAAQAF